MQTALVAFDSKQLSVIMKKMLEDLGFKCFFASTPEEVVDSVLQKNPSVLFVDWTLNKQDIADVLHQLSTKPIIIFVSKEKGIKQIQKALDMGINEYIMKPFDNDILQSKLSLAGLL